MPEAGTQLTRHSQELTIFHDVAEALKSFNRATTVSGKIAADNSITSLLGRIMAISVQYPNLKADQQFLRLSEVRTPAYSGERLADGTA